MRFALVSLAFGCALFAAEVKDGRVPKNVSTYTMKSESLGMDRKIQVALPTDYESSQARYPVLYLLHGYGDDHTAWSYMTNIALYAARHRAIVVMPSADVSFYVNAVNDPAAKFEDYVVKDLVEFTDSSFRTIPLPRARAIAGLSMGGYGAAFLGLKHRNRFHAIGAFSGAISYAQRTISPGTGDAAKRRTGEMTRIFGPPDTQARKDRDPFTFIDQLDPATAPMIHVSCGGQDFLIEDNRAFVKALAAKKIPYEYREISPRGHTWDFWDDSVRVFLGLLDSKPGWKTE